MDAFLAANPRMPAKEAAAALGVSAEAVRTRRHKLGITRPYRRAKPRQPFQGRRTHCHTEDLVSYVHAHFPDDRLRMVVADLLKRYETLTALVQAMGDVVRRRRGQSVHHRLSPGTIRMWLRGQTQYLDEHSLAIVEKFAREHANLPPNVVTDLLIRRKKHLDKVLTEGRRKLNRRNRAPKWRLSVDQRQADSKRKKAQWADEGWRLKNGTRVIRAMLDGRRAAFLDEEIYLAYLIRMEVNRFKHWSEKSRRMMTLADVFDVLCRIANGHRRRFPNSSLKFEDLPEKVEWVFDSPRRVATIRTALRCDRPKCTCRRSRRGLVHCPAPGHKDRTPSLSVTENSGHILLHCHSGCTKETIIAELSKRGLWSPPRTELATILGNSVVIDGKSRRQVYNLSDTVQFVAKLLDAFANSPHPYLAVSRDADGAETARKRWYQIRATLGRACVEKVAMAILRDANLVRIVLDRAYKTAGRPKKTPPVLV
jgi:hypothetical protein